MFSKSKPEGKDLYSQALRKELTGFSNQSQTIKSLRFSLQALIYVDKNPAFSRDMLLTIAYLLVVDVSHISMGRRMVCVEMEKESGPKVRIIPS